MQLSIFHFILTLSILFYNIKQENADKKSEHMIQKTKTVNKLSMVEYLTPKAFRALHVNTKITQKVE